MLDPETEERLAGLTDDEWAALSARVREPAPSSDPKQRAADALRATRAPRRGVSKEQAAAALRAVARGGI